jgi:hypothetical protein
MANFYVPIRKDARVYGLLSATVSLLFWDLMSF